MAWYLYMVRTRTDSLYTGITTDLERRLAEHEGQGGQGAKSLRARGPLTLEYRLEVEDRAQASRLEYGIKRLARAGKEALIDAQPDFDQLLKMLNQTTEEMT